MPRHSPCALCSLTTSSQLFSQLLRIMCPFLFSSIVVSFYPFLSKKILEHENFYFHVCNLLRFFFSFVQFSRSRREKMSIFSRYEFCFFDSLPKLPLAFSAGNHKTHARQCLHPFYRYLTYRSFPYSSLTSVSDLFGLLFPTLPFFKKKSRWWAQVDSNHRPHAYQACALTH